MVLPLRFASTAPNSAGAGTAAGSLQEPVVILQSALLHNWKKSASLLHGARTKSTLILGDAYSKKNEANELPQG